MISTLFFVFSVVVFDFFSPWVNLPEEDAPGATPLSGDVQAILYAWFAGQEIGNALADLIFGDFSPSGKLPTTFPRRLGDTPAFNNYPGERGEVVYGEGLFVGYRYYDSRALSPAFCFGHGLSYTTFEYGPVSLGKDRYGGDANAQEPVEFDINVTNSGLVAGAEVVQVYVSDPVCSVTRPPKELRAFQKVLLQPGETKRLHFTLASRALAFWDVSRSDWTVETGEFLLHVGSSSADIRSSAKFSYDGLSPPKRGLTLTFVPA